MERSGYHNLSAGGPSFTCASSLSTVPIAEYADIDTSIYAYFDGHLGQNPKIYDFSYASAAASDAVVNCRHLPQQREYQTSMLTMNDFTQSNISSILQGEVSTADLLMVRGEDRDTMHGQVRGQYSVPYTSDWTQRSGWEDQVEPVPIAYDSTVADSEGSTSSSNVTRSLSPRPTSLFVDARMLEAMSSHATNLIEDDRLVYDELLYGVLSKPHDQALDQCKFPSSFVDLDEEAAYIEPSTQDNGSVTIRGHTRVAIPMVCQAGDHGDLNANLPGWYSSPSESHSLLPLTRSMYEFGQLSYGNLPDESPPFVSTSFFPADLIDGTVASTHSRERAFFNLYNDTSNSNYQAPQSTEYQKVGSGHGLPNPETAESCQSTTTRVLPARVSPRVEETLIQKKAKMDYIIQCRKSGMSYKEIKEKGQFSEAESTLRGMMRNTTKDREERPRKPIWTTADVAILKEVVSQFLCASTGYHQLRTLTTQGKAQERQLQKVPWKQIAANMAQRGCHLYGNATVKKKYFEVMGIDSKKDILKRSTS